MRHRAFFVMELAVRIAVVPQLRLRRAPERVRSSSHPRVHPLVAIDRPPSGPTFGTLEMREQAA